MPPDFACYRYRVEPDERVSLDDHAPGETDGYEEVEAREELDGLTERIADLQARLYAEERRSVLVVLQGIDAAGKDSTVAHVFRAVNPAGSAWSGPTSTTSSPRATCASAATGTPTSRPTSTCCASRAPRGRRGTSCRATTSGSATSSSPDGGGHARRA